MFRLTIKTLRANKVRFALTTFGVVLAVSFVVSAFVLGDGLRRSFTDVSEDITAGIDLEVRNVADFGDAAPLSPGTVDTVAAVDGVANAVASIESAENAVRPTPPGADSLPLGGPPLLAFNWIDDPELSAFTLVEGAPPEIGQFTMDVDSAAEHGFVVGDAYDVMTPGGEVELTLSGTSSFGPDNATLGAVLMQVNTADAGHLFGMDGISSVAVRVADGADVAAVRDAVAATVPSAEVVDHATILEETATEFTEEIDVVEKILLGFGGVALFVSIFIIYNTFAIVLGQRTRELALLRSLGAAPRQLRRSALGEALAVGVVASAAGIAGGVALAKGIDALFGAMGVDLVDYPLILAPRTIVAAILVGIGVTLVAAAGPARRAATVPPVAALTGTLDTHTGGSRRRKVAGLGLLAGGLLAGFAGLAGLGSTVVTAAALTFGTIAVFLGVTLLSPLAVRPVTGVLGWPLRPVAGVAGRMAQRNAARNPRRTATTAAALMIGLTLVCTAFVVGASVKATVGAAFDRSAKAEYYVTDDLDEVDFPVTLAGDLRSSDIVDAATGFTPFEARVDGTVTDVVGFDFGEIERLLDLDVRAGGFDSAVTNPAVVSVDEATASGLAVGDVLSVETAHGTRVDATIAGLFADQAILGEDYLFDTSVLDAAGVAPTASWLAVSTVDGASPADVDALVTDLSTSYPYASVETAAEFRDRVEGMVDAVLAMVNVMVALAVIIALIGIANTMALSVFERTRELGLVRAVGMTRRQLRRMVRFEAALVATFGAALGVGLGVLFGVAVAGALPAALTGTVAVPVAPIAIVVVVAAGAGVVAAWLPARRAGRLDVLHAIAH